MNWQNFLIGNGCFAFAYLLRRWNKWTIKVDWNPIGSNIINWIWVVALIICGAVFILASLPSTI